MNEVVVSPPNEWSGSGEHGLGLLWSLGKGHTVRVVGDRSMLCRGVPRVVGAACEWWAIPHPLYKRLDAHGKCSCRDV